MAWLEKDRHGRLRIGFKYYDGLKCREPLGVSANKQTIAEARRLCATIQLELKARTFDYAKRFPDSDRIKQRGIETPQKIQRIRVTELADSWLLSKQGEVKKSTHGYYKEVAGIFIQRDAIGTKTVLELRQEANQGQRAAEHAPQKHGMGCPESNPGVRSRQEAAQ